MATKKRGSKKSVTVEIDVKTLAKLVEAAEALSELAGAFVQGSHDPRARAIKGSKRRAKRR